MANKISSDHEELNDLINKWNPMQEDYTNSQFNQYSSGPGVGLDQKFNINQQKTGRNDSKPYLVLKRLPQGMTIKAIHNICSSYGRVSNVRDSNKNDYIFVDMASVADMEAVYRALEKNSYGFDVSVGKQFQMDKNNINEIRDTFKTAPMPMRDNAIDLENRNYRSSKKQHPRPNITSRPHVSSKDYNSSDNLLQQNDPQRHFLIEEDSHELERAGLVKPCEDFNMNSKYNYRTGRAYIQMPEKVKSFITEKCSQSNGQHNSRKEIKIVTGSCEECKRVCDAICSRCSKFFCGIECQRKAWPKHRYVCGKPEHLQKTPTVEVESVLHASSSANATNTAPAEVKKVYPKIPRSGKLVTITAVTKSNVVFVRSKAYEDNFAFFKIVNDMQANAKNFKRLRKIPKCGQVVVTLFNGQYNRAMILNMDNLNAIKLVYIDYGNLETKLFDDLLDAPIHYSELPRFAIPVILKNVPDVYMTDEIRKFMYSYLKDIEVTLKYNINDFNEDKGAYQVELIDEATNQNLNKVIAELAKPTEPSLSNDIIDRNFLKYQLLPNGQNMDLVVMDNSLLCTGCISCTTVEYAQAIQKFQKELQNYAESLEEQSYAPRVEELCIAKYGVDQKWYRGRCLDLVGDGHPTIVFFDYGNISLVHVKNIRRYPTQFSFPIFTFDCEIHGLPELCDEKIVSKLEELIPNGSVIKCNSVEVFEDNFYVIKLDDTIQSLQDDGLLD